MDRTFYLKYKRILVFAGLFLFTALFIFLSESGHQYSLSGVCDSQEWDLSKDVPEMTVFSSCLDTGSYSCTVSLSSASAAEWRLLDMDHNTGNNELGVEIASGTTTPGSNSLDFSFVLNEKTDHLNLIVASADQSVTVSDWFVTCTDSPHTDSVIFLVLAAAFWAFLVLKWNTPGFSHWLAAILLGILLTTPFFTGSLLRGGDMRFHVNRIVGIADGLANGQFPVRMDYTLNNGYGFVNSILYPDLFLYLPAVLCLFGLSAMNAYKLFVLLINISAACIGYYSFRRILRDDRLGMVCTVLYLLVPYRLVNLYTRAAVSEALANVFFPLLFLGIYELFFGNCKKWYLTVIAATCILHSHILSVEICLFFVLCVVLLRIVPIIRSKEYSRILCALKALVVFLLLNLWFILPFFTEFGQDYFILTRRLDFSEDTPSLWQLFFSDSDAYYNKTISLGFALLAGTLVYLFYRYYKNAFDDTDKKTGFYCLLFGGFSCYAVTEFFPWSLIQSTEFGNKYVAAMQFPWRMLGFASLFLCILVTLGIKKLWEHKKMLIAAAILLFSAHSALLCLDTFVTKAEIYMADRDSAVPGCNYADYYRYDIGQALEKITLERGDRILAPETVSVSEYEKNWGHLSFRFRSEDPSAPVILQCPYYAYGYYTVWLNGEEISYGKDEMELMTVTIPTGMSEGTVEVRYTGRKLFAVGDIISLFTILAVILYGLSSRFGLFHKKKKRRRRNQRRYRR